MSEATGGSQVFNALADPTRREILLALSDGELTVNEIAETVGHLGRTAISSHLRILRLAGLVTERRESRYRYYRVNPAPASEIVGFMGQVYRTALLDLQESVANQIEESAADSTSTPATG